MGAGLLLLAARHHSLLRVISLGPLAVIALVWIPLALLALAALLHLAARVLFVPATAPMLGRTPWLPAERPEPLAEGEPVEFAGDGVVLRGTYLPARGPRRHGVIACCHEFNGDRWNMRPYADDLRGHGFDCFVFDFRNHGTSGRTAGYEPTPWVTTYEVADVRAAIDYLASRDDALPQGVGLFGVGKGGTAALCAAAADPRVGTVAVDTVCPARPMQIHHTRRRLDRLLGRAGRRVRVPESLLGLVGTWSRWVLGWRYRCRFVHVDRLARRVGQPVLLIHGQVDPHVPPELARALADSMPQPADLWVVPLAGYNRAVRVASDEYHRRTARFFLRHLSADLPWNRRPPRSRTPSVATPAGRNGATVRGRVAPV